LSYIDSDIYADGYGINTNLHTYDIEQRTRSLENRVIYNPNNSKFTGVVGLFLSDKDAEIDAYQNFTIKTAYTTKTTAIYGEGSYALTPKTKLTAGLRTENEDTDKVGTFFLATDAEQDTDETYTLPKLAISHSLNEVTTIGASIRKGYSPSGTYIDTSGNVASFDSEEVTSLEFSSKSDFGNGTTLTANIFYNDFTDYQTQSGLDIKNVDEATTYGFEVEATTWANEDLELWASLGLLKSEIDKYTVTPANVGNNVSDTPETNASIGLTQYVNDDWSVSADTNYVGTYYSDLANSDSSKVGNYLITNAQVQYKFSDLTINAYVKNITNEDAVYFREGQVAAVGQSRTVGLSAVYRM